MPRLPFITRCPVLVDGAVTVVIALRDPATSAPGVVIDPARSEVVLTTGAAKSGVAVTAFAPPSRLTPPPVITLIECMLPRISASRISIVAELSHAIRAVDGNPSVVEMLSELIVPFRAVTGVTGGYTPPLIRPTFREVVLMVLAVTEL
jgi:hypothetical protein